MQTENTIQHQVENFVNKILDNYPSAREWDMHFPANQMYHYQPEWCYSPLTDCFTMLKNKGYMRETLTFPGLGGTAELIALTAVMSWAYTKEIYCFDATLQKELLSKPLLKNFSKDDLMQLPEPCVYIKTSILIGNRKALGFFAWLEYDKHSEKRKAADLLLVYHMKDGSHISYVLPLSDEPEQKMEHVATPTDQGNMVRMLKTLDEKAITKEMEPLPIELYTSVQLLLYLCADESDIYDTNMPQPPDEKDAGGAVLSNVWKVGYRIGNAIRKYTNSTKEEQHALDGNGHAGRRPHMRRAHWHSFWLGTREGENPRLVVRWMPSTLVGAAWKQESPDVAWLAD